MHFTCSGLKVHVGHEKDMKTSAVNKIPCVKVQHNFLNMPQNISIKSISYADECGTTVF